MLKIHPTSREDWLDIRHKFVSSTESAALFGHSPYLTAYELAVMKTGPRESAYSLGERGEWGKRLEAPIAEGIGLDYSVLIRKLDDYEAIETARMGASFDYLIGGAHLHDDPSDDNELQRMLRQYGPGVLEIKNVDSLEYRNKWTDEEAPAHIEIQLQHQLHCSEYKWGCIGALIGGNKVRLIVRAKDDDVGRSIEHKIINFWTDLGNGIMPPFELPEDADIIRKVYKYAEPNKVLSADDLDAQSSAYLSDLCDKYATAGAQKKAAEDEQKSAAALLLVRIADAEKVMLPGFTISAGMVAPARVEAFERAGYRNLRIYPKKVKESK